MRTYFTSVTAACLAAGSAHAGALDRTGQPIGILFEEGRYLEFSLGYISPRITGENINPALGPVGAQSGDIGVSNFNFGAGYKADINETWSYAFIIDEPYKAEVAYPTNPFYFGSDSSAEFQSVALTALLQYNFSNGFSVYGGPRLQQTSAAAEIAFAANYAVDAEKDWGVGYVAGVAYERPDIALRVSLTYNSKIDHKNDVTEEFDTPIGRLMFDSEAEFFTPESVNLAAQSGIAADTLLFGSIRWANWSEFELAPEQYTNVIAGQPLLSYVDDVTTYTLGLGRNLNENWALSGSVGYERNTGNLFTNLGPNDGQTSLTLAAIYSDGPWRVTTGIRYAWIGDTTTAVQGVPAAEFNDNTAVGFGVRVGYNF